jgi:branched-chain amino acid transport system permease protein
LALLIAALGYGAMSLIGRSQLGNSFLAVRENEVAASSLGLDSVRLKMSAFALGSAYAGAAGALYAHFDGFIGPESFSTGHSILLFCALVVGGLGRPLGAVLAVGLFVLGQEFFRAFSQYQLLLFGATVVGIMILAPQGSAGLLSVLWRKLRPNLDESGRGEAREWELDVSKASGVAKVHQLNSSRTKETHIKSGSQDFASSIEEVLIEKISVRFGGVTALNNVSFDIRTGEILCLIGPNGAGKTSLLNVLGGQLRPESGSVLMRKRTSKNSASEESLQLVGCSPHEIARLGLSRTFQTSQLFSELSVLDNVLTGRYVDPVTQPSVFVTLLQPWRAFKKDAAARRAAESSLRSTGLFENSHRLAKHLPYGSRRILEITRALAMAPKILLLDEPSAGMNQSERKKLAWLLHEIRESGVTLLIVAHDLDLVRNLADRVVVLDHGEVIYCGPPEELRQSKQVVSAYLGNHGGAYATRR